MKGIVRSRTDEPIVQRACLNRITNTDECASVRKDCYTTRVVVEIYTEGIFIAVDRAVLGESSRHRLEVYAARWPGKDLNRVSSAERLGSSFAIAV